MALKFIGKTIKGLLIAVGVVVLVAAAVLWWVVSAIADETPAAAADQGSHRALGSIEEVRALPISLTGIVMRLDRLDNRLERIEDMLGAPTGEAAAWKAYNNCIEAGRDTVLSGKVVFPQMVESCHDASFGAH